MSLNSTEIKILNESKLMWGSCYTTIDQDNEKYTSCKESIAYECSGYFEPQDPCSTFNFSNLFKHDNNWQSYSMPGASFSNISIGSEFQGIIYAGNYTPSSFQISDQLKTYTSQDSNSYAIFVYSDLVSQSFDSYNPLKKDTSAFSGSYNKFFGNKINSILNSSDYSDIGILWSDFCVPSLGELVFLKNQFNSITNFRAKLNSLLSGTNFILTSSTVFVGDTISYRQLKPFNQKFLYGIDLNSDTIPYPLISSKLNIHNVVHTRSIPLT